MGYGGLKIVLLRTGSAHCHRLTGGTTSLTLLLRSPVTQNSDSGGEKMRRFLTAARGVGVATLLLALLTAGAGAEADADSEAGMQASQHSSSSTSSSLPTAASPEISESTCAIATKFLGVQQMPFHVFNQSVSVICYHYNQPDILSPRFHQRWKMKDRKGGGLVLTPPRPNPNGTQVSEDPADALTPRELLNWRGCVEAAQRCCADVLQFADAPGHGRCPSVWDGWHCWNETLAGVTVRGGCPSFIFVKDLHRCDELYSSRTCMPSGHWLLLTDYATCSNTKAVRNRIVELVAAYGVSMICLVPALAVLFLLYRQLHGHRITLHRNLFAALLLHAGSETLVQVVLVLQELDATKGQHTFSQEPHDVSRQNSVWCRAVLATTKYFRTSSFMWMFCEGFYLHRLLAAAFSPDGSLLVFYLIGWGLPVLPTVLYAALRAGSGDSNCWLLPSSYEWVIIVPNVLSLLANAVFLVYILRVLVLLKKPPEQEPSHYRRAVRATLVLVPLFGVHLLLTLFRPSECTWRRAHQLLDHMLDGLQGAAVACIFCFCNGEVHEMIRRAHRTLVDRYQPGLRPSKGSHSFSTAQATI